MAGIDKIYGTTKQYDQFKRWCKKNCPNALPYFYPRSGWQDMNDRTITNFPIEIDKWMLDNCSIEFITNRIRKQHNL